MLATAFSASVHDRYESYIECLMRKNKQQPGHGLELQAFEASELVRARSLAALLRETQTKLMTGIDRGLAAREKTLRQAIHAKEEEAIALLATDYKREQFVELEKSLTSLREQHQQLAEKLKAQNPHYDEIPETRTYSIKQIQESIIEDNDTMLLEYFLGKNGSYAWAITRNDARFYNLPEAERITGLVQDVYKLVTQKPTGDTEERLNKANRELADKILTPLADHANVKRVIVVADDALNYIPFQSLPGPSGNPLVETYEIVNAPSASILGQLRQEKLLRPRSTRVVAAFGDPAFKSNYAELKNLGSSAVTASTRSASGERSVEVDADSLADPAKIQSLFYSKFELQNLRNLVGQDAFVKTGFDASRAALETTDFSKFAILHFATHGLLDPENPQKSGFYLSTIDEAGHDQNGFISMQDVYNLRVPVALLVLSACRTALGKEVSGEGLIGLTRGFMHAGASSVVASLWKVDDEATSELMKDFYTNILKKDMRPAEALREAQNTLRQNPQWRSPYYWAGFTFQGEFKEPIRLAPSATAPLAVQNAVGGALLLTLLAGIGWGYWRRRNA
jgi:CHAT domain-containing protein